MNFRQGDIIIRKTQEGRTIWLSQRFIMEVAEISEKQLRTKLRFNFKQSVQKCYHHHNILPDTGKAWRWAKLDGGYYYDLARIPNRAPQNYRELFGDADQLVRNYEDYLHNSQTSDFENQFKRHLNSVYRSYLEFYNEVNDLQRVSLAKACAVLDFILENKDDYPGTKNKIYKDLEPILKKFDLQYIPHHHLKLKAKVDELFATESLSIIDVIQLPRTGNNNAVMHDDPEVLSWIMQLRSMDNNFTNEFIIRKVSDNCEMTGKRVPSRRWFGMQVLEKPATVFLTSKRFGSSRKSQIHKGYIPFENALFAGDCWEIDATRVNIISHTTEENKDKFLMVVAVRDVHSGDVLGYSFDHSENHQVYAQAIKMAVKNTGYLPYEIVTDRFPGHNTPQIKDLFERMESLGVKIEFVFKANNKARIERWFSTLQNVMMQESKFYYGEGIQSRNLAAHRSPEYIKRIKAQSKKAGFDMYAACNETTDILERFRETPYSYYSRKHKNVHRSPKQIHEDCTKPHVTEISAATISMLFDLKKNVTVKNEGQIETEIVNVKMEYFISPAYYDIIKNYHTKRVVMTYDIDDLEYVYLWEKNGNLLKSLCEAQYFERPQKFGPNKRLAQVAAAKAREKAIKELKDFDLNEAIGEENMMMGMYGEKAVTNAAEDFYLENEIPQQTTKKVSGSDIHPDDFESDYLNGSRSEY